MKDILHVNNHPVHLSNENRFKTALIPFCAFGEDMENMGTHIDGIDVPVCNSFVPKNHDKQLCYEVDLDRFRNISVLEKQLRSGLVLLLDFNEIRQLEENTSNKTHKNLFSEDEENSFTIHFDTISKIASSAILNNNTILDRVKITKEGQYNMNSLKEIKGKKRFYDI